MNKIVLASALAVAFGSALAASPSIAANARHPYQNVNRSNDKGNDTGDAQVERLNSMQLNENYGRPGMTMPGQSTIGGRSYSPDLGSQGNQGNQRGNMSGTDR